jgi:hypothetical protein
MSVSYFTAMKILFFVEQQISTKATAPIMVLEVKVGFHCMSSFAKLFISGRSAFNKPTVVGALKASNRYPPK